MMAYTYNYGTAHTCTRTHACAHTHGTGVGSQLEQTFFFFYSSLIQYIWNTVAHLPTPPSSPLHLPSPQDPLLQRRAGLPGISPERGITSYNTMHRPSYQGWQREPSRGKWVSKTDNIVRDTATFTVTSSSKAPSKK